MIKKIFTNDMYGSKVRQNLSSLRQELKNVKITSDIQYLFEMESDNLIQLLNHEDAKTRKNVALLMGDLGLECFKSPLFHSYLREEQRFIKSSYLSALSSFDCTEYIEPLNTQLKVLMSQTQTPENKKHIQEEIRAISNIIIQETGISMHTFIGFEYPFDCILLTNKLHKQLIEAELENGKILPFAAGVRVITDNLSDILALRTYSELLFVVPGLTSVSLDPIEAANQIAKSNLLVFLSNIHSEKTPFHFRVELKSKLPLDKKTTFSKKFSSELESLTNRSLINSTSNYEIELRLIENKQGFYSVLLKLYTIIDHRFSYRKESIAASIRPVNAAQLVALAKDHMIDNSRTLDPFCGVGTMLIERQKVVKGNTSYGIDFYAPAIEKAKINTSAANQIIHFINRNYFEFTHEYKFDEIFTNMPSETGHKSLEEIEVLYQDFFDKSREVLEKDGTMILYSHNPELVNTLSFTKNYDIIEAFEVVKKENAWLFVLKFKY